MHEQNQEPFITSGIPNAGMSNAMEYRPQMLFSVYLPWTFRTRRQAQSLPISNTTSKASGETQNNNTFESSFSTSHCVSSPSNKSWGMSKCTTRAWPAELSCWQRNPTRNTAWILHHNSNDSPVWKTATKLISIYSFNRTFWCIHNSNALSMYVLVVSSHNQSWVKREILQARA